MTDGIEVVRHAELIPCRSAFIDAHTPGSDQKENYTIIGAGVSENPDQHVHIKRTPGFNIGAAAQPARCTNSLHSHRTAEVFIIHTGVWRFFWGVDGGAGEVVLHPGDIVSLPTHMFRGFANITALTDDNPTGYGFMFAVLGGDDAGGGVLWAPQVLHDAKAHGLILLENGRLVDTKQGETVPADVAPMQPMGPAEIAVYDRNRITDETQAVYRAGSGPSGTLEGIIGDGFRLHDRPGFNLFRLQADTAMTHALVGAQETVLICGAGTVMVGEQTLSAGDTAYLAAGPDRTASLSAGAVLHIVEPTDDPAGASHIHEV